MDELEHIRSVPLAPEANSAPGGAVARSIGSVSEDSGTFVVEGILLAQAPDLPAQGASDVRESMLFAQLAADHEAARTADPAGWHEVYTAMLATLGWTQTSSETSQSDCDPPIDWSAALLAGLAAPAAELAETALEHAEKLAASAPARMVWTDAVTGQAVLNLALAVAARRDASPAVVEVRVTAQTQFEPTGFIAWSNPFTLETAVDRRVINEDVYGPLRATVKDRLGERIARYIIAVD